MAILGPLLVGAKAAAAAATVWLGEHAIVAGIARIGLSIAAKYALGALIQKGPAATAVKLETSYGEDRPREVILGKVGQAGQHIYRNANGTGNKRVLDVYKLSDFRVTGVTRVRNEGEWTGLGADEGTGDDYRGKQVENSEADFYIHIYDGTQTVADPVLINSANPTGRWTSAHKGIGIAYAIADQELHREDMRQVWEPFFEVVGPNLYDWRKDDTVGGDGDDRFDDQDSWSGSVDNPALQMYALERGIYNGTELIVGKGVPASRLPLAEWTVAANICDENVSGNKRYTSAIIAAAGSGITHDQNMQGLLEACAATWVEDATGEYPIVGAIQSPTVTITDADIVPDEPFRFSRKRTRSELVNTLAGTWLDPEQFYEAVPFATRIEASALAEDGERLASSVPYGAVNVVKVADRLADIAIKASRYQANGDIVLPPRFIDKVKAGRWIRWNSARFGDRYYQVIQKRLGPLGPRNARNVYLTLQEVGNGIFDPTAYVTVPTVPAAPGEPVYASEASNFNVFAVGITSGDGQIKPGLRWTWNAFADQTVVGVMIEYRPVGATDSLIKRADVPVQFLQTSDGILANTLYEYRHWLVTLPVRTTFPTSWQQIMTPAEVLPTAAVLLDTLAPDAYAAVQAANQAAAEGAARIQELAANVAEGMGVQAEDMTSLLRYQGATAGALRSQQVRIDQQGDKISAFAEILDLVNVAIGGASASSLFRMTAEAGSGDVVARVVIQVRAAIDAAWVNAGTIWEAGFIGGDPTKPFGRIVNNSDQFLISTGSGDTIKVPFAMIDGVLYANEMMIQSANIGDLFVLGTSNLDYSAVTDRNIWTGSYAMTSNPPNSSYPSTVTWDTVLSFSLNNVNPNWIEFMLSGTLRIAKTSGANFGNIRLRLRNTTTGLNVYESAVESLVGGGLETTAAISFRDYETAVVQGVNNYELQIGGTQSDGDPLYTYQFNSARLIAVFFKR